MRADQDKAVRVPHASTIDVRTNDPHEFVELGHVPLSHTQSVIQIDNDFEPTNTWRQDQNMTVICIPPTPATAARPVDAPASKTGAMSA